MLTTAAAADLIVVEGGTPTTSMTSWAELDPGETREEKFDRQVGDGALLDVSGDEQEDANADEESSEVGKTRLRACLPACIVLNSHYGIAGAVRIHVGVAS